MKTLVNLSLSSSIYLTCPSEQMLQLRGSFELEFEEDGFAK